MIPLGSWQQKGKTMNNRFFTIAFVLICTIWFALIVMMQRSHDAGMAEMIRRQAEIVNMLEYQKASIEMVKTVADRLDVIEKRIGRATPPAPAPMPQEDFSKVHTIPLDQAAFKGDAAAPVTIVGFLDLQCPYSARFQPVIDEVLAAYPGKVRYAVKHFPLSFHPQARPAAKAVLAAGRQGKYYEMVDAILKNVSSLTPEIYEGLAKDLGLKLAEFSGDMEKNDAAWTGLIEGDIKDGASAGVRGTPTFFLNGRLTRARTLEAFKAEIDPILAGEAE